MIDNKTIRHVVINSKLFPCNGTSYHDVTGSICNFETDLAAPLRSCVASFLPIQEGTGDPSPSNPRPISGYSSVNVTQTGTNLFGGSVLKDGIVASMPSSTVDTLNKTVTFASNASVTQRITDGYISGKFKANTQYTFILALEKTSGVGSNLRIYYTDGTYTAIPNISTTGTKEIKTVVSTSDKTVNFLSKTNQAGSTVVYYDECGVFEGSLTESDFAAYVGTTYPVSLGQTVYGGEVDIISGAGVSNYGYLVLNGSEDWDLYYMQNGFALSITDMKIGSAMKGYSNFLPTITSSSQFGIRFGGSTSNNIIYCCRIIGEIEGVTDVETWKTYLGTNNLIICYPLETPETFSVDPETLETTEGINNIWNDAGDTSVSYAVSGGSCNGIMKFLPIFYPCGKGVNHNGSTF